MPPLDLLLDRPGLDPAERLLILAKVAVWPGALERLGDCVRRLRDLGAPRAQLEEVMLQAVLFCGFPRVINAFHVLQDAWPPDGAPAGGARPGAEQRAAGEQLFETIYGDNAADVRAMLRSFHGELHEFVLDTAYGRILSRPALSPRLRELMAVGILAHTDQVPQLVAHGRGALRFGALPEQVAEAIYSGTGDQVYADRAMRRITRGR